MRTKFSLQQHSRKRFLRTAHEFLPQKNLRENVCGSRMEFSPQQHLREKSLPIAHKISSAKILARKISARRARNFLRNNTCAKIPAHCA
jgi:hypothetical protein